MKGSSSVFAWRQEEQEEKRGITMGHMELLGVMDIFMIFIVVIVSEVYMYDKTFLTYILLHVNYNSIKVLKIMKKIITE